MRYLALTLLILLVTGCKNFVETESNIPPAPPDPAEVLEAVIYALAEQYGQGYDRYASIFVQHCTSPVGIARDLGCYQLRNEFFNTDFEQMYTPVFSYLRTLLETAIEKEKPHYAGVAQILTAAGLGKLTDTYGDIPWTEALQREIIAFPKYDTQEEIYHEIQRLLSDAIINLNAPTTSDLLPGDPIYKGDIRNLPLMCWLLSIRPEPWVLRNTGIWN